MTSLIVTSYSYPISLREWLIAFISKLQNNSMSGIYAFLVWHHDLMHSSFPSISWPLTLPTTQIMSCIYLLQSACIEGYLKNSKSAPTAQDIRACRFLSSKSPNTYPLALSIVFTTFRTLSLSWRHKWKRKQTFRIVSSVQECHKNGPVEDEQILL